MTLNIQTVGGMDLSALLAHGRGPSLPEPRQEKPDFGAIDENADGAVSLAELSRGPLGGSDMAERLFGLMDADDSGGVSQEEFDAFADKVGERIAEMKEKLQTFFGGGSNSFGGGGGSAVDQFLASMQKDDRDPLSEEEEQTVFSDLQGLLVEQRQLARQAEAGYALGSSLIDA